MEFKMKEQATQAIAVVVVLALVIISSGCPTDVASDNGPVVFQIGDTGPAGGVVFYDKEEYTDGWRYLEAWTADQSGGHRWKPIPTSTPGTGTSIGSGYANTYSAMAGTEHPVAWLVRSLTHGGYSDWFLPSKEELNQMYLQRGAIGGFASAIYWSSSEYDHSKCAWVQYFVNGNQHEAFKDSYLSVRAARRF